MRIADFFLWRRERRRELLRAELEAHLRMDIEERIAAGEAPADAALNARKDFGNAPLVHEVVRDMWAGVWLERLAQDIGFGTRMLRRTPGFAITSVLCLALGIGTNMTVLSWMEGILLRPYPGVVNQSQLVAVAGTTKETAGDRFDSMSWPDFNDLSRATTSFSSFIATKITGATLTGGDRADRLVGLLVSANYFDALGVRPVIGRGFLPEEDSGRNGHPVTVISYRFWHDHFEGDRDVIGRTIAYNGVPHVIVGVAPEEFIGTFVGYAIQFWLPASQQAVVDPAGYKLDDRSARWIEGFARLKPNVPLARAQQEIVQAAARLEVEYPNENRGRSVQLLPLWRAPFDGAKELLPMLRVASLVAVFVLFIACANVANLLLVRSLSRRQEMTVRLAIGAGRDRLLRQLVTESLILAALATAIGVAVAYWSRHLLGHFFGPNGGIAITFSADLDWRVMTIGAAIGLGSTVLFGLVPALQTSSVDLAEALKSDGRANVGGSGARARFRSSLVILQVALSFVLLVGATLLLTSLRRLQMETPGFSTNNVLTTAVNLFASGYDSVRAKRFDRELVSRVQALPGIEAVALARSTPFSTRPYDRGAIAVDNYRPALNERPVSDYEQVTPGYFATLGIPLVSGRDFTSADADTTIPVAIVSEAMVKRYWGLASPLGTRLQLDGRWMQVIGVARDIKHRSLLEPPQPIVYVPLSQHFSTVVGLYIRTTQGAAVVGPALVREIHALDPNVAPYELLTMRAQVERSTTPRRIAVILVGLLGCLALLLAAIGLYGVVSYSVSQSTRELGLRVALGAAPIRVMGFVLSWGLRLIGIGLALGIAVAAGTTRLFGDLLYGVSSHDPRSFAIALLAMSLTALFACAVPAIRAARLDAMRVLRGN